ncbi:MAG: L-histidine N(alpha)-methyltransferase [Actinomycetota bacterium]|nr:L-histidine N(alpha)-methyltransferase [Actinomycetota bacterium]
MVSQSENNVLPADFKPGQESFREEALAGLRKDRKELPCKYLYDELGAFLFERICTLSEYYIPRVEKEIMESHVGEMTDRIGRGILLLEYGCGDCAKTRILLDGMHDLSAFVPLDISREQLSRVASELAEEYPRLELLPVCADYTGDFDLPEPELPVRRRMIYFPGSTIGNFEPFQAFDFLKQAADICGPGGTLLIGVDLKKEPDMLHRAYNDSQGITAAFNLNMLRRINRELEGDFELKRFGHYAFYNPAAGRVEMHLVSLEKQDVHLDGETIHFQEGESIWTESSYKYGLEDFKRLVTRAGFEVDKVWTDERRWFSVQYLVNRGW